MIVEFQLMTDDERSWYHRQNYTIEFVESRLYFLYVVLLL